MKKIIISSIIIAIVAALTAYFAIVSRGVEKIIRDVNLVVEYDVDEYGSDCGKDAIVDMVGALKKEIVGRSFADTTLYVVREKIEKIPFVKECNCFPYADSLFRIEIAARKTFVRIICADGRTFYADAAGEVMDLSAYSIKKDDAFVVFRGACPYTDREWVEGAVDLAIKTLTISHEATLKEIVVTTPTKLDLVLETLNPAMPQLTVHFGDLHSKDKKLARLNTFFKDVFPTTEKKYKSVDVRYEKQLICK